MSILAAGASTARWAWSFDVGSEGVLALRLSGRWLRDGHLPPRAAIERELRARPAARVLAFDARSVENWDTAFVVFVRQTLEIARGLHLDADLSGLPEGVRKLLDLAAAVPERETGETVPPEFLARLGTPPARAGRDAREMITFLGEACLALGRFVSGRARLRRADLLVTIQEAGAEALGIVSLISFLVGLILAYVGAVQLRRFGAEIYVADLHLQPRDLPDIVDVGEVWRVFAHFRTQEGDGNGNPPRHQRFRPDRSAGLPGPL